MRQAVALFGALYCDAPAAALDALSWVLTPEADQGVETRVEAAEGVLS